jgi:hypothetical protein
MNAVEERKRWVGWLGRIRWRFWPVAVLALLCATFYWDVPWLTADRTILGDDATNLFVPWLRFAVSSIRNGQLPLWNPYFFSGSPFVANPQPALFYPPTWLALVMPVTRALGLIAVLHLWLAGLGTYAWLRSERASAAGALVGATVFAFSGYFSVRVRGGHVGVITTGAWLPLMLWMYRRTAKHRSWRLAVIGGLPVGLSILAGHTTSFIYVALGLVAYALFHAWEGWRQGRTMRAALPPLVWVGLMLLFGLAVAAVQVLPLAELAARSTRQASATYDFAARFSWPPGYLMTLLVPNFFGEPSHTGYWGDGIYDESIFYVGILPLLLALLGARLRHRLIPFLCALGLGALFLALGQNGALHPMFFRFVPLFRLARAPARAGFLFTMVAAAFTGLALTALQSSTREVRMRLLAPLRWPLVLTITGGALALVVAGYVAFALGREANPAVGRLWHQANQVALFLVAFLLAAGLLAVWRDAPTARPRFWQLALGLVVLDLWTFGSSVIHVRELPENAYWRIVSQAVEHPQAARVLPWGLNEAEQNGGMAYGLRSVFAYDPLTLQRYEEFITSRPDPRARTYDLLNAGYLVTTGPQEFADGPDAPRLLLEQSGVQVYERQNALPRAWVAPHIEVMDDRAVLARVHEPDFVPLTHALLSPAASRTAECDAFANSGVAGESRVEIVHYEGNFIEAQVRGEGGVLIFSEVHYPGWKATVDGKQAQLVRADYLLRGLCVPAGEHRVELVYDPPLLKLGFAVSGLALLSIAGAAVWPAVQSWEETRHSG